MDFIDHRSGYHHHPRRGGVSVIYRIKRGNHYSGFRFWPFLKKHSAEYIVRFTESCRYTLDGGDQADTNKLFGFTHGFPSNSSRWGWKSRGDSDRIVLVPYIHEDGAIVHPKKEMTAEVRIGETVKLTINRTSRAVIFLMDDRIVSTHLFREAKPFWGYRLWPYFGGNRPAPHDMELELR